jgi:hypothetical protein
MEELIMKRITLSSMLLAALVLTSCGPTSLVTRQQAYPGMYAEKPLTLLIMPPINDSRTEDAGKFLYTTISTPLDEAGYYVISPNIAWNEMRADGIDPKKILYTDCTQFGEDYGADALVFSTINFWDDDGLAIHTKIQYQIKSTKTNEILYDRTCDLVYNLVPGGHDHYYYNDGDHTDPGRYRDRDRDRQRRYENRQDHRFDKSTGISRNTSFDKNTVASGSSSFDKGHNDRHENNDAVGVAVGAAVVGLFLAAALTSINTQLTPVATAARECNRVIFDDIPRGKYSPLYQQDMSQPAGLKDVFYDVDD